MALIQKIKNDQVQARKNKDAIKAKLLTTLLGEASIIGKNDGNRETTDAETCTVIKKFIKNANELLTALDNNHVQMLNDTQAEISILEQYLPRQMAESDLIIAIEQIIQQTNVTSPREMGTVMKELKNLHDGLYDGKTASKLVQQALQNL